MEDTMLLKDMILNGIVKDNDKITISKPLTGSTCDIRKGNCFQDQILDFMDSEIRAFSWDEENGYSVELK